MKRLENNVVLTFVFFILLGGIWFFENRDQSNVNIKESLYSELSFPLERLEYEGRFLYRKQGYYHYGSTGVIIPDQVVNDYLNTFKGISKIEQIQILPKNLKVDFELVFNQSRIVFYKPIPQTGNFFVQLKKNDLEENILANSIEEFEGLYKDEADLKLKSFNLMKEKLIRWEKTLLKNKIIPESFSSITRKIGEGREASISFHLYQTSPEVPEVLGYNKALFDDYKEQLKRLTPVDIFNELPRSTKLWGSIILSKEVLELHSLDGIYYLKKGKNYWQLSEEGITLLLKPVKSLWNDQFHWVTQSFQDLKGFKFKFGKNELPIQINKRAELVFQADNLNQKQIQGIKEILCYVSQCREDYKALRINSFESKKSYPYQIEFSNHKILFKLDGPLLKLFDPGSKVELEYLWSLFREGDLFAGLSRL